MLHRAHHGPDYVGDWAWTPPSIRALQKAGFRSAGQITVPGEPGPGQLCILDVAKFLGRQES